MCNASPGPFLDIYCVLSKTRWWFLWELLQMCVGCGCMFPFDLDNGEQRLKDKIYVAYHLLGKGDTDGLFCFFYILRPLFSVLLYHTVM